MTRLISFVLLVLALGAGFAWLADRPGELSIIWQGQQIGMSLMVAATISVSLMAAVMFLWWLARTIWTSPHAIRRHFRARKRDRGYQALSTGLIAAGAGDAASARKMLARTKGLISSDQEPLVHLLEAQAALIEGRHDDARRKFELMADDPETRELGLRGLYLEARRLGATEAARQYAERAAEKAPQLPWAADAVLEERAQTGEWDQALRLLEQHKPSSAEEKKQSDRRKVVLMTARARARLDSETDPKGARDDALAALKIDENFIPAGLIAAKGYLREGNLRKAAHVLERLWKADPHPDVARLFIHARIGDSPIDRLKRAEKLEALRPNNAETLFAVGQAALDARKFSLARTKAEAAARLAPSERAFLLLADIEDAETGDQGRIRHWMNQALKAPRDPAWTADGVTSPEWLPVSPVTGKLDAFQWKTPVSEWQGPIEEGAVNSAEEAIRTLPPVAITDSRGPTPSDGSSQMAAGSSAIDLKSAEKKETVATTSASSDSTTSVSPEKEERPFFGGLPDDPGVKNETSRDGSSSNGGLRLF
ncbi:heme biosynthesis protein HemY [Rhizobium sp. ARZ01]|uniref:heme biosynthesis protein HemY n=1 Tax=Rhizobium sp. ARZ01 TaxID=2769313 RepID=UPI00178330DC|nr:heme biosynthesis protein HemY [Rhizobium sp. ARZ01]MBD9374797.1 heme biosynthesis protein HemY [Rhizobium sp. ARZ01]